MVRGRKRPTGASAWSRGTISRTKNAKKQVFAARDKVYDENRIRSLGDSLTCCGVDGLSSFRPNTFNLNHILNGDKVLPSPRQKLDGTAGCFQRLFQDSLRARMCAKNSFADWMIYYYKTRRGARAGNVAHIDFANFKNLTHAIETVRMSKQDKYLKSQKNMALNRIFSS